MALEGRPTGSRSEFSGTADNVVQARDISGGVHFHSSRVLAPPPRQLPGGVRDFVNRIRDLRALDRILTPDAEPEGAGAVCVIAGGAGVGKTSLAVHWGHRARARFADGQLHVNLRGYDPGHPVLPELALGRFLEALGVPADAQPRDLDARSSLYRSLVADKKMLVILDNADRAGRVRPLLPGAPGCRVLVTSRDRMSGLVSQDGARRLTLGVFPEPEAVELLQATIREYRDDEDEDVAELARLCARLPLALRIAAERAASRPRMPLSELIEQLRDESSLWEALSSQDEEDAEAVRTVFAWSYRALPADAARFFRLLGLYPGPDFSAHAAAALAAIPARQAVRLLDVLVGAHLVEQTAADRYQFHDLLRAYALSQTEADGSPEESEEALRRLFSWYTQSVLAVQAVAPYELSAHRPVFDSPEPGTEPTAFADYRQAFMWFRAERPSLVAAITQASESGLDRSAWQMAAAAMFIYAQDGFYDDWFAATRPALAAAVRDGDPAGEAALLASLGMACRQTQRLGESSEYYHAALAIHRARRDHHGIAWCLDLLGFLRLRQGDAEDAWQCFAQSLALCEEHGLSALRGYPASGLAAVLDQTAPPAAAAAQYLRALEIHRLAGDVGGQVDVLLYLPLALLADRQLDSAARYADDAVALAETLDNPHWQGQALHIKAKTLLAAAQPAAALASLRTAAAILAGINDRRNEAAVSESTSEALLALGRVPEAADFLRWAAQLHDVLGEPDRAAAMRTQASALRAASTSSE